MNYFRATLDRHIADRVQRARIFRGLSRGEFAASLNIPLAAVEWMELGYERLEAALLVRVIKVLEVPPSFFFDGFPASPVNDNKLECWSALGGHPRNPINRTPPHDAQGS